MRFVLQLKAQEIWTLLNISDNRLDCMYLDNDLHRGHLEFEEMQLLQMIVWQHYRIIGSYARFPQLRQPKALFMFITASLPSII